MIEFENFGWNVISISFTATIFFSILAFYGLLDQVYKIYKNKSVKAISSIWIICGPALFGAITIYGYSIDSLAITISGIARGPLHIPIIVGIFLYRGLSKIDLAFIVFVIVILTLMWFSDHKDIYFIVITSGALIPTAIQPIKMWKEKNAGVVSLKMISIFTASTCFWIIYCTAIKDWPVLVFSSISLILFVLIIVFGIKYQDKE